MAAGDGHGEAVWATAAWRDRALAWADVHLAAAGLARDGEVTQPHLRPWATVLRIPTTTGPVWIPRRTARRTPLSWTSLVLSIPMASKMPRAVRTARCASSSWACG